MTGRRVFLFTLLAALAASLPASAQAARSDGAPRAVIVAAPGFPGTTESAADVMADFASHLARRAGRGATIAAEYHNDERLGTQRISRGDAAYALVPLPFFLEHEFALGLAPLAGAEQHEGGQGWSLVAARGAVAGPADLDGFEIVSVAGYAPRFVRGPALARWGRVPASARIVFDGRLLPALRRAAAGEKTAVLLDAGQAASLAALPFAGELDVVARSGPLPDVIFCAVGERAGREDGDAVRGAFLALADDEDGRALLAAMRIARVVPLDRDAVHSARAAFAAASE